MEVTEATSTDVTVESTESAADVATATDVTEAATETTATATTETTTDAVVNNIWCNNNQPMQHQTPLNQLFIWSPVVYILPYTVLTSITYYVPCYCYW